MAKESMKAREVKRAHLVNRYAEKRKALKEANDSAGLQKITGRPRGYMRIFGLSRNTFRELALNGKIPGITKASW